MVRGEDCEVSREGEERLLLLRSLQDILEKTQKKDCSSAIQRSAFNLEKYMATNTFTKNNVRGMEEDIRSRKYEKI